MILTHNWPKIAKALWRGPFNDDVKCVDRNSGHDSDYQEEKKRVLVTLFSKSLKCKMPLEFSETRIPHHVHWACKHNWSFNTEGRHAFEDVNYEWHFPIGPFFIWSQAQVTWTVYTRQHWKFVSFCPWNPTQEFKQIWIGVRSEGQNLLVATAFPCEIGLETRGESSLQPVPASCHCNLSPCLPQP